MEKPKTWLSAIVRPDAVYIQAYIFSTGYGYITSKYLTVKNISTNEVTEFQLVEETNGTCLFKTNQKINPALDSSFILQLEINIFDYESDNVVEFLEIVEFKTPVAWNNVLFEGFNLSISSEVVSGKTTIEPKLKVIISGSTIPNNSVLRICGSNAFANMIDYNSYDTMKEFVLDGSQNIFENTFKLGVSGLWNFKAFLKLPNNTIVTSDILSHTVNQGDIYVVQIVESDNIVRLKTSKPFFFNELVKNKRVGICTVNEANTLQNGSFYEFHDNSGQWFFDFKESLKNTGYRLPSIAELEAYCAIKSELVGLHPISYYSNDVYEETNMIKGFNFSSGVPTSIYAGDSQAGYLILEDFENNIVVAEPLGIPVFDKELMVQPSGYKITDLTKKKELNNSVDSLMIEISYSLPEEITNITYFGGEGFQDVPSEGVTEGSLWYNVNGYLYEYDSGYSQSWGEPEQITHWKLKEWNRLSYYIYQGKKYTVNKYGELIYHSDYIIGLDNFEEATY